MCLFLCNTYRLSNNLAIYNQSIVPEHLPGGGGISIYQYSLDSLYTMHQYCRNWWTTENKLLPLVRYVNCTLKIYQAEDVDIVFRYQNTPPFTSTQLTYPSTQPSMMMMLKNTILIPSKNTHIIKKGYRKLRINPPNLMTNKWFFQKDIATKPLLITHCTAASFQHYYIGTDKMSNTCTVPVLNTALFQNRYFAHGEPYYCKQLGTQKIYLYASYAVPDQQGQVTAADLIFLGESQKYTQGLDYNEYKKLPQYTSRQWSDWLRDLHLYMGNPFHNHYLNSRGEEYHSLTLFQCACSATEDYKKPYPTQNNDLNQKTTNLVILHEPLVYFTRYNPNTDKGNTNITYLLPNYKPEHGLDPPQNHRLILEGFPLWINWWGYLDFQKQQHEVTNIDTSQILVTKTECLHGTPTAINTFIPLCQDFIQGKSPFENSINPIDLNRWYPMVQYQEPSINDLLKTGPGTAKHNGKKTVEAKLEYTFRFKFGGNPAPMVDIKDPTTQPIYPIPSNFISTNSLQDPTTPPELFLYNFDQRRDYITKQATERMQQYQETKKNIFTDATTTPGPPTVLREAQQTSEDETSDSEKEEETILQHILKQRKKQHQLKLRIRQLLAQHNTNI